MSEKITIVGAGVSGRALALYAARRGADVFVIRTGFWYNTGSSVVADYAKL